MFFIFFFLLLLLVYRAAREYGVPESTLRDRTLGLVDADNCISGSKRTFAVDEEHELAEDIKYMASMGYGYYKQEVINLATDLAVFQGKKKSRCSSTMCYVVLLFLENHKDLQLLKPS